MYSARAVNKIKNLFSLLSIRTMSESTHLERTADKSRGNVFSRVIVTGIRNLSPTVKGFTLKVENPQLKFRPGQWVDVHIPGITVVGGYSMTSPPHLLEDPALKTMELAIKQSPHAPAEWMYTKCSVGDELKIQVGGDFWYFPSADHVLPELVLIAGGVGINPLMSMLLHHIKLRADSPSTCGNTPVHLLYSSKTESELLFKNRLLEVASTTSNVNVQLFTTSEPSSETDGIIRGRRMAESDILEVLGTAVKKERVQVFVCGPPPMIDTMVDILTGKNCKLSPSQVHYERWW